MIQRSAPVSGTATMSWGHGGAIADTRVVAFGDDVEHVVFDDQVKAQLRVGVGEGAEDRRQQQYGRISRHVDAQAANRCFAVQFEGVEAVLDGGKAQGEFFRQQGAGVSRFHGAAGAVQQLDPQARFQVAHGVAQRRGGHAQLMGGMAKTATPDDRHEHIQIGQFGTIKSRHIKSLYQEFGSMGR